MFFIMTRLPFLLLIALILLNSLKRSASDTKGDKFHRGEGNNLNPPNKGSIRIHSSQLTPSFVKPR